MPDSQFEEEIHICLQTDELISLLESNPIITHLPGAEQCQKRYNFCRIYPLDEIIAFLKEGKIIHLNTSFLLM
jgi:hypothetical protein